MNIRDKFRKFALTSSQATGTPIAFGLACGVVILWALFGHTFHYSNTWQLIINTGTTIVTFVMVFLIQNTQNRDSREIHLKLDELIRANKHARNQLIDLEKLSDEELNHIHDELIQLNEQTEQKIDLIRTKRKHLPEKKGGKH